MLASGLSLYEDYCRECLMQESDIEIMSLNVNGLGNPAKRAKVIAKLKKEKKHIFFLQETHLLNEEHEKLKKIFYSSCSTSACDPPACTGSVHCNHGDICVRCCVVSF